MAVSGGVTWNGNRPYTRARCGYTQHQCLWFGRCTVFNQQPRQMDSSLFAPMHTIYHRRQRGAGRSSSFCCFRVGHGILPVQCERFLSGVFVSWLFFQTKKIQRTFPFYITAILTRSVHALSVQCRWCQLFYHS